jgi:hypothetical protein
MPVLQGLDPSQTHQALIVHDIVFQLPEEITPSSDETCLLWPTLEETDHVCQGRGLDEFKRSHMAPFLLRELQLPDEPRRKHQH